MTQSDDLSSMYRIHMMDLITTSCSLASMCSPQYVCTPPINKCDKKADKMEVFMLHGFHHNNDWEPMSFC